MTARGPEMAGEGLRKRRTEEELELQIHGGQSSEALGGQMQWGGYGKTRGKDRGDLHLWEGDRCRVGCCAWIEKSWVRKKRKHTGGVGTDAGFPTWGRSAAGV